MKLGAQFFSIRDKNTTPEGLYNSFKEMSDIGYKTAQMSAICQIEPERLKGYSEEFSLPIVCTHSPLSRILEDTDNLIKEHKIYGCDTVGLGMMPKEYHGSYELTKEFLNKLKEPIKRIEGEGLKFAYHNHAFEFVSDKGTLLFDLFINEIPSLNFILDTYWVKYAGYDYLHYIKLLGKERIQNVHFKDMKTEPQGEICPCGEGVIDFKPLIKLCDELGIPNALVEQDNAPSFESSYEQMKISFNNLIPLFK